LAADPPSACQAAIEKLTWRLEAVPPSGQTMVREPVISADPSVCPEVGTSCGGRPPRSRFSTIISVCLPGYANAAVASRSRNRLMVMADN
jgi:hypothetical protein